MSGVYNFFSILVIVAGVVLALAVLTGVIWMIVKWRSPEVQELEAPVRQYMLSDEERAEYQKQYEQQ